jgi:GntR family transcriptional regulator, transcriptional repressor for pyruvate dehydrogenase complex
MDEFAPVRRTSVSVAVFDQIAAQILAGTLAAGVALPPERSLTESFAVNRQAVREALQRLDQLGLVEIRHGDATRVRDFRSSCGLDLLPRLFLRADGTVDPHVVRSVMEMRAAIGADAAALCAIRADQARIDELRGLLDDLEAIINTPGTPGANAGAGVHADADLPELAALQARFWDTVVEGADNICYRLSLNALRRAYLPAEAMIDSLMAVEYRDLAGHRDVVAAIAAHDADRARSAATTLLAHGTDAITTLFTDLEHPR